MDAFSTIDNLGNLRAFFVFGKFTENKETAYCITYSPYVWMMRGSLRYSPLDRLTPSGHEESIACEACCLCRAISEKVVSEGVSF
jgi:hypothetical protein